MSIGEPAIGLGVAAPPDAASTDEIVGRMTRSGLWNLVGTAAGSGATFVVAIILARVLGPADLGRYSFLIWIVMVVPVVLAFGLPTALTRFVSEKLATPDDGQVRSLVRLSWRLHLATLVPVAAVAAVLTATGDARPLLAAAVTVGIGATLLLLSSEALLAGLCRFRALGLLTVVGATGQIAVTAVAAGMGLSWEGFVVLYAANMVAGLVLLTTVARHGVSGLGRTPLPAGERSRFYRFAGVVALAITVDAVVWGRPELFFLERYRPAADLGLYAAALRLSSVTVTIPLAAARVLMPEFTRLRALGMNDVVKASFPRVCFLLAVLTAPIALGGAAVAGPLATTIFGDAFSAATAATAVLLAGGLVNAFVGPATAVVLVGPRPRLVTEVGLAGAFLLAALDIALIPRYGAVGAAVANVSAQAACGAAGIAYAWVKLDLRYPLLGVLKVVGIAAVAAALARLTVEVAGNGALPVAAVVGAGAYALLLNATRTFTLADLRRLRGTEPAPA